MKRKLVKIFMGIFIIILISLAINFNYLFASDKLKSKENTSFKIGYVDMATLLIFHPLMQYYSFNANVFIKPLKSGLSKEEFLKQIRERQEKYKILIESSSNELKRIQDEINAIDEEINKLRVKASREQTTANQKYVEEYTKLSGEEKKKRTAEYHKQLLQIDNEYYEAKKKFDELKKQKETEKENLISKIAEIDYLNEVESQNFFNSILDEIDQVISEVATENKIPVVLNSNYLSMFVPNDSLTQNTYPNPVSVIKTEIPAMADYSYILSSIENPFDENKVSADDKELTQRIKGECIRLLNKRVEVAKLFARYRVLHRMVVYGGVDLTCEVLKRIFKKHSMPQAKIDAIINVLNELLTQREDFNSPTLVKPH